MSRTTILLHVQRLHDDMMTCVASLERSTHRIGREVSARTRTAHATRVQRALCALEWNFARTVAFEEDDVFPVVLGALPESHAVLASQRAEHRDVESMIEALMATLSESPSAWRDERVRVAARDLVDLLHIHLRKEAAAIHRVLERVLTAEEVELAGASAASGDCGTSARTTGGRTLIARTPRRTPDVHHS